MGRIKLSKRRLCGGVVIASAVVLGVGALTLPASAAPGDTAGDTTTATVIVGSTITLTNLTPAFQLTGNAGATASTGTGASSGPVTFTVTTNNITGFNVSVIAESTTLDAVGTSTDSIPIDLLTVRESGTTPYSPLTATTSTPAGTPVQVHSQAGATDEDGLNLSNDYSMDIPFVQSDSYVVTLDYLATAL